MRNTLALLPGIEDSILLWVFGHFPAITACVVLIFLACWITSWMRGWLSDYRNRFVRVETDIVQLNYNQIGFTKRLSRIEKKLDRTDRKVDHLEKRMEGFGKKLDRLILHLHIPQGKP